MVPSSCKLDARRIAFLPKRPLIFSIVFCICSSCSAGSRTLAHYTDSFQELCPAVLALFDKNKRPHELIRRIAVSFEDLVNKAAVPTEMSPYNALRS